jgi:DNA-binding transcriptional ArsR family regulator
VPHPADHSSADRPLDAQEAEGLAESMLAFATASRLRILYALMAGERHVDDLALGLELAPNTISQQLRVLRAARLVRARREGRRAYYAPYDAHVGDLLTAIRHHAEHARLAWGDVETAAHTHEEVR